MICIVLSCAGQGAAAQTAPSQPPLTAEVSDVAALEPAGPHRLFVLGSGPNAGADILEADSKDLNLVGVVPANHGLIEINQDASRIFVAEMFYRRENRGPREDVLAVYDGRTLNLLNEIELPGRLIVVPKMHVFDISADAKRAYIYDMMPASRVHVIDLEHGVVLKSVDLPGCALAMPYGERHFATICGDGTVGAVKVGEDGAGSAAFSAPFFKPNEDPLFESAVVDRATGYGWFLTFTGKVYPIKFGDAPEVGAPWTLSAAAGLQPVGTGGAGRGLAPWRQCASNGAASVEREALCPDACRQLLDS